MVVVSPDVNSPPFSQICARISAELVAVEIESWQAQLANQEYRAFLVALYRLALADDEDQNGEMTRDDFLALLPDKQRHYHECALCGQIVDRRQLDDVLFHETHQQRRDIQGGEWIEGRASWPITADST
jgi:hypothetical protein